MLNELERGVQTLFGIPSDASRSNHSTQEQQPATLDELREQWETRLNFVQVGFIRDTCTMYSAKFCHRIPTHLCYRLFTLAGSINRPRTRQRNRF